MVIEETGWGVVPATAIGGTFRDRQGELAQVLERHASASWLVVQGRAVDLHSIGRRSSMTDLITPPLRVALFEPRIPPNTGNIARTCAAFGLPFSLIEPLGFSIDDRQLKRAGLDYWPHVDLSVHRDFRAISF